MVNVVQFFNLVRLKKNRAFLRVVAMADLHSKILDAPHPQGPNSFKFMQFMGKFGKIVCSPPPRGLTPPPRGNSGSVTGLGLMNFAM